MSRTGAQPIIMGQEELGAVDLPDVSGSTALPMPPAWGLPNWWFEAESCPSQGSGRN